MSLLSRIKRKITDKSKKVLRKTFGVYQVAVPYQINLIEKGRMTGKVVIVTGGSGAIGRAISCRLAAEGAIVYVCGTNENKINSVISEIKELNGKGFPCKLNLTDENDITRLFGAIHQENNRLDALINCAGGSARSKSAEIFELETEVIDNTLAVNLRGSILCTREASKLMIKQKNGHVINISSVIGEHGKARFSEYSVAKAGIIAFTKSVAMELGKYGINVNCVSPGIVQRGELDHSTIKRLAKTNYLNDSYGRPEDISEMVAYLLSKEASFITGQNIIIDGGRSLGLKGD